jgi:hypothetical protein
VATALSEGEAKPKHCYLLEVKGDQYRLVSQALDTVRPFVFESVRASEAEPSSWGTACKLLGHERKLTHVPHEALRTVHPRVLGPVSLIHKPYKLRPPAAGGARRPLGAG